ncbi:Mismatch repair protein msh3, partial [Irineochytrium annulatum]
MLGVHDMNLDDSKEEGQHASKRKSLSGTSSTQAKKAKTADGKGKTASGGSAKLSGGQLTISSFFTKNPTPANTSTHAKSASPHKATFERFAHTASPVKPIVSSLRCLPSAQEVAASPIDKPAVDILEERPVSAQRKRTTRGRAKSLGDSDEEGDVENSDRDGGGKENGTIVQRKRQRVILDDSDEDDAGGEAGGRDTDANVDSAASRFRYAERQAGADPEQNEPLSEERLKTRERFLKRFLISSEKDKDGDGHIDENNVARGSNPRDVMKAAANAAVRRKKGTKYTPLELQYLEIKQKYPECLLIVEVGYKFRFFQEDALTAARELNIVAYLDKNFHSASIPTGRLNVHVKKLVQLGYKVGVVRQTETAAIKAAGDNKSAPFTRKLTNIYTRGTFLDDLGDEDLVFESRGQFVVCLKENPIDDGSGQEKVSIAVVAVQLSTGELVYDEFQDGLMRVELETRLSHLQPVEILVPEEGLTVVTERFLKAWGLGG